MYFSVPFFFLFCSSILFSNVLSKWNVPFYLLFNLRYSIPSLRENKIKMKSPFHLFHFNIPLNSILFKRYIWRIIVFFLFPRTFPTISYFSPIIDEYYNETTSFFSFTIFLSSAFFLSLRFWLFNAGQRKVEGSIWGGISHQRSCPWMANSNFSFNLFFRDVCSEI